MIIEVIKLFLCFSYWENTLKKCEPKKGFAEYCLDDSECSTYLDCGKSGMFNRKCSKIIFI